MVIDEFARDPDDDKDEGLEEDLDDALFDDNTEADDKEEE